MKFHEMPQEMQNKMMGTLVKSIQELLLASTIHFEEQPEIIISALQNCFVNFVINSADPKDYHNLMAEIMNTTKQWLKDAIKERNKQLN